MEMSIEYVSTVETLRNKIHTKVATDNIIVNLVFDLHTYIPTRNWECKSIKFPRNTVNV